jgi:endonuclease V-like protein UPF0215 family
MSLEYISLDFTGPGARYSLIGDRQTKHPVLPVINTTTSPSALERNKASGKKWKDSQRKARIAKELEQAESIRPWAERRASSSWGSR